MLTGNGTEFSLRLGELEASVLENIRQVNETGVLPALIEVYVENSGIKPERFTDDVRAAMVEYLLQRGASIDNVQEVIDGKYDELFALAYEHAVARKAGRDDPIDAARQPGGELAGARWDFSVDLFEEIERQGVVRDNILAAGAIDYIFELGEHMGVFKLVDALVLNWASGSLDVVEGDVVSRLYRYWKLRDERPSAEERGMLYRRVLNKSDTDVLDRMVVNEEFLNLWHNLMAEVADYVDKTERITNGATKSSPVSRSRIYQAVRDLQYNLTEYCTGMAHIQVRELYAQLQECMELMRDQEILAYLGGTRRKSVWTGIEKLSKKEFGGSPNIEALRSLAVDGNAIFRFIADYSDGGVRQEDFTRFLQAAEAYILNYSTVGGDIESIGGAEEEIDSDSEELAEDEF